MLSYFSPKKHFERSEKKLQKAFSSKDQKKFLTLFCEEFNYLLRKRESELLAQLFLSYESKIEDSTLIENKISSSLLKEAVKILQKNKYDTAALKICETFAFKGEAIDIFARQARPNELLMILSNEKSVNKELVLIGIECWEKYNGDIRKSPILCNGLNNIAKFSIESIPDHPGAKEVIGQFKEAAELYEKRGKLDNAAQCFEKAEIYTEALRLYKNLEDREGMSRIYETLGDLEEAFKCVVKPERKVNLLTRMERFIEARECAAGLPSPEEYFNSIKQEARKCMELKIQIHDFIKAIELADCAQCGAERREEIVQLGREHFDKEIAFAQSEEDINAIYRKRVDFEEKAGHFEEAAHIAKEILKDYKWAGFLYTKANKYNLAINILEERLEENETKPLMLAKLHEEAGSLLKAAQYYESAKAFEKAYENYNKTQQYIKAIECYKQLHHQNNKVLKELYKKAGEYEKIIDLLLQSRAFNDLEEALSIAKTYNLTSHIKIIQKEIDKLLSGSEKDLEVCFTQAKKEILNTYSSILGIDFGTTNSVVALFNKKRRQAEIAPGTHGTDYEPSYFGFDEDNHPLFGEEARLRYLTNPDCAAARIKRSLGRGERFSIKGKNYRIEEIIAKILQQLRLNADKFLQSQIETRFYQLLEERSNDLRFPQEMLKGFIQKQTGCNFIKDIVLTVPAYFNDSQKRATRDAAEIAGLNIRRLIHEPTAAALAYGYRKSYSGKLAVIDLGGGTLDISILDVDGNVYEVQTVGGDTQLGGSDIDAQIMKHIVKDIKAIFGVELRRDTNIQELARLRDACENMKINLSSVSQFTLELNYFLNRPKYTFTMTRNELETLIQPLLNRIKEQIEKTLKEYPSPVDHFLLVGNATKMPAVENLAAKTIRRKHLQGINAGTVVAMGAALEAAVLAKDLEDTLILDIVPYSLGIAVLKRDSTSKELEISRLIEKNTTIPVNKSNIYTTSEDNQRAVNIQIFQGESDVPQKNHFLGKFVLDGIKPAPAGTQKIDVFFNIDSDCVLTVTAVDQETRNQQSIIIKDTLTLSPHEKEGLKREFKEKEYTATLEKELFELRQELGKVVSSCRKEMGSADQSIHEFLGLFKDFNENYSHYTPTMEQTKTIQEIYTEKDRFIHGIPRNYLDQFNSIMNNIQQVERIHFDFTARDIVSKFKERIKTLNHYKRTLEKLIESIEKDIINMLAQWMQTLKSIEPKIDKMGSLEVAHYYLTIHGNVNEAKKILEATISSPEGLSKESFKLLLRCYTSLGSREEYRNTLRRFGTLLGIIPPDFAKLNVFLKAIDESVFLIKGVSKRHGPYSGSGFSIAPDLVVTNRHVVDETEHKDITIIGKKGSYTIEALELDPINDIALLTVKGDFKPFRLGEFNFVEPGEKVLAVGFPVVNSDNFEENIFISHGIINSIRDIGIISDRVIFMDTHIGRGMSGGPLINDLGEVIGINTCYFMKDIFQPVALPIYLVKKYLIKYRTHDLGAK